jgi:2-polyprenyl-3-methyl-5-hydroxy-6-metoxy-1,4-benzoquinol methylase
MKVDDQTERPMTLEDVPCPICGGTDRRRERTVNGFQLVKCRACAVVYVSPRCSLDDIMYIYKEKRNPELLIDLYDRLHTPSQEEYYDRNLAMLESRLPRKGRILDFACAAGYFVEQAARRGWEAHGVDVGEWSRMAAERRGVRNIHIGLLSELRFPDGYFDAIYAAQVFEHLTSPTEDLAELRRILRKGGYLHVDVPNYRTVPIMLNVDDFYLNMPPQHVLYFTPGRLRRLLRDAGFEVDRVTTEGGLKWENLIGRPVVSEVADVYRNAGAGGATPPRKRPDGRALLSGMKRVFHPLGRHVFYDWAKVGIVLIALAHRPEH